MGLQDRDYVRDRDKKTGQENGFSNPKTSSGQSHHCLPKRAEKKSITYLLYPVFALLLLWYSADTLLDKIKYVKSIASQQAPNQAPMASQPPVDLIPGGIILQTDPNGHFRGTAFINDVPVPFLVDTGATQTVIPAKLAMAAGLPFGKTIQKSTAGGQVIDQLTRIDSLKIGNSELKNIDASINQHLTEVLIGMNTLKYFRMTQNGNTLTLVAYTKPEDIAEIERKLTVSPPPQAAERMYYRQPMETVAPEQADQKAKTSWKKRLVCDGQNKCKTVYGE